MLVTLPEVNVTKSEQNIWNVEIWVTEELFDYLHPFIFSDLFETNLSSHQFQVLLVNHYKKLRREAITKDVNKVMRVVSKQLTGQPNVTSHSFRIGYITQLWKDSKDIEFVKQSMGHRTLDTTSAYVNKLSDQERQKLISQL